MKPLYAIERWTHGWLLCKTPGSGGIPINALSECLGLFPENTFLQMGIPHHLQVTGKSPSVMMCIATKKDGEAWRAEIERKIAHLPMPVRWWMGLDVGESSTVIYSALSNTPDLLSVFHNRYNDAVPQDADDFGRCVRLLEAMPEWKARLPEVAAAWPKTKWPQIIARWDEIAAATPEEQNKILRTL